MTGKHMKIAIAGAAGRMGQMLIREIARTEGAALAGALESLDAIAHLLPHAFEVLRGAHHG